MKEKRLNAGWRRRFKSTVESGRRRGWKDLEGWRRNSKKFINQVKREEKKSKKFTGNPKPLLNPSPNLNKIRKKTFKLQASKYQMSKKQKHLSKN